MYVESAPRSKNNPTLYKHFPLHHHNHYTKQWCLEAVLHNIHFSASLFSPLHKLYRPHSQHDCQPAAAPWFPLQRSNSEFALVCSTAESGLYYLPFALPSTCFKTVCVIHSVNICFFSWYCISPWTSPFMSYSTGGFQFSSSLCWK